MHCIEYFVVVEKLVLMPLLIFFIPVVCMLTRVTVHGVLKDNVEKQEA